MSGRSYTYISNNELADLRRRARDAVRLSGRNADLANQNKRLKNQMEALRTDNRERIRNLQNTAARLESSMNAMGAAASKERQALREQLRKTVQDTNAALKDMADKNKQALDKQEQNFRNALERQAKDTASAIKESHDQLREEMSAAVTSLNTRIDTVNGELAKHDALLADMAKNNASLLEQAREFSDTADAILEAASTLNLELLLPGRSRTVQDQLNQAKGEIALADKNPANSSVARRTSRQAVQSALQLYQDAMHAEQERQQARLQAARSLSAAEVQLDACRHYKLPVEFEDGSKEIYDVDSMHWSNGDMQQLTERLTALREQLNRKDDALTAQQLENICEAGAQLTREAVETAQFSINAFISSQDRADCAADIVGEPDTAYEGIARDYGLVEVTSHGYQDGDMRAAHHLCLRNPVTGLQVAVTQLPVIRDREVQNRIEAEVLDYGTLRNPAEGDRVAAQILAALNGSATSVYTVSDHNTCGNHPARTASDVRREMETEVNVEDLPRPDHAVSAARA